MVKIVWSEKAIEERNSVFKYWNKRNGSTFYSQSLRLLIKDTLKTISIHHKIGMPTNRNDTRIKIIRDYFLIYRVTSDLIIILAFWDSRQDPEN